MKPTPFLAVCLLAFTAWFRCLAGEAPADDAGKPPCCRELKPGAPPSDSSLYQLESEWTSDAGRHVRLDVLRGRPQVVAMFFASCEFACPIIVNDMKRIEAALPEEVRGKTDFLLVSIDPERDTPEALRAFRGRMKLPMERWTLLTGRPDDVRELAALLGVNYRKDARGQFAHSNLITLLNAGGEVVAQQSGLNQSPDELVRKLNTLVNP
ncbi:MAG: SCO family protein [Verrucomicrobiae bacterium]|nr:SCO family protein [Verrucomicrobiae bacterium]